MGTVLQLCLLHIQSNIASMNPPPAYDLNMGDFFLGASRVEFSYDSKHIDSDVDGKLCIVAIGASDQLQVYPIQSEDPLHQLCSSMVTPSLPCQCGAVLDSLDVLFVKLGSKTWPSCWQNAQARYQPRGFPFVAPHPSTHSPPCPSH